MLCYFKKKRSRDTIWVLYETSVKLPELYRRDTLLKRDLFAPRSS